MIHKPFGEITKQDIDELINNAVSESKTLDYKQELHSGTDGDKKEFLADITSFANASGGDILYGISEKTDANGKNTGEPDQALGLKGVNIDQKILELEGTIRQGVDPRIPNVQLQKIDGFSDGPILHIRIPKSWISPHMVTFKGTSRFFSRTSAGKYQLDVREIRSAFLSSAELTEQVRRFRDSRLAQIVANEGIVPLNDNPKIIFHLIPLSSLDSIRTADVTTGLLQSQPQLNQVLSWLQPISGRGSNMPSYNFDGVITTRHENSSNIFNDYLQIFRNGVIEAVDSRTISPKAHENGIVLNTIPGITFAENLISSLARYLDLYKHLGISPPIVILLTLVNVRGAFLRTLNNPYAIEDNRKFERNTMTFPEQVIEDINLNTDQALRPILDIIWQSAGFEMCNHYYRTGRWEKTL
ncbi:MAG: ATP-binding protein [Anaerolineales bacterium]|nr:ATP-binding protein [Anaerolineales bacterium]